MGSWDCYCALCCGPLRRSGVHVGDSTKKALKKRAKIVTKSIQKRQRLESDDVKINEKGMEDVSGGEEDEDQQKSKVASNDNDNARNQLHHGNSMYTYRDGQPVLNTMYNYYEENSYDPRLLAAKDVEWLDRCRTLGYNPDTKKTFISGLGQYADYGSFEVNVAGDDPNDPHLFEYEVYQLGVGDIEEPTFPFHEACYRVLARRLGYDDPVEINKDVLYTLMREKSGERSCMMLDYGGMESLGLQFWDCQPGEEYLVCNPDEDLGLSDLRGTIWHQFPTSLYHISLPVDLSSKVRHDPLSALPFDILHTIFQHLSVNDTLKLMRASYHVHTATAEPQFWIRMIRTHLAPWFWEIDDLVTERDFIPALDYKSLFLWLDKVTTPKYGLEGPFMGVANRRRIWGVCGQLAPAYKLGLDIASQKE